MQIPLKKQLIIGTKIHGPDQLHLSRIHLIQNKAFFVTFYKSVNKK